MCKELCGCLEFGECLNARGLPIRLSSRPTFGPLFEGYLVDRVFLGQDSVQAFLLSPFTCHSNIIK